MEANKCQIRRINILSAWADNEFEILRYPQSYNLILSTDDCNRIIELAKNTIATNECGQSEILNRDIKLNYFKTKDEQMVKSERLKNDYTNVYIMIDEHTGYYKIGKSKNVVEREKTLLSQAPKIKLIYSIKVHQSEEKFLHNLYINKHIRGEWFSLNESDLQFIANKYKSEML